MIIKHKLRINLLIKVFNIVTS